LKQHFFAAALALVALSLMTPASAAVIVITQAKAEAGTVTPNDLPGFPVTLSVRGAYRFDTNLNVPLNKVGLQATTNYVDIDMNGFILSGLQGNSSTRIGLVGLQSTFGLSRIHNGYITGFKSHGIRLAGISASSWVVEDMQIFGNAGKGIDAFDSNHHRFSRNSILRNVLDAIDCGDFCRIDENAISDNFDTGIACGEACHVEGNLVAGNDGHGVILASGTVLGNTISGNGEVGISNPPGGAAGFGNNTLLDNAEGQASVSVKPLHPNYCRPACLAP
jgi:hypothetical protein